MYCTVQYYHEKKLYYSIGVGLGRMGVGGGVGLGEVREVRNPINKVSQETMKQVRTS